MKLVLASSSPRRKEILASKNVIFTVRIENTDETILEPLTPTDYVMTLAKRKAMAVSMVDDEVIIGADTVVVLNDKILSKPKSELDAIRMLSELSGKTHSVYTGVCLRYGQGCDCFFSKTDVTFYTLTESQIKNYIETKEPLDKAGAYGIQGAGGLFVRGINGDYFNAVGLPVAETMQRIRRLE